MNNNSNTIYQDIELNIELKDLAQRLINLMNIPDNCAAVQPFDNHWSEQDIIMITYGDSVMQAGERPLTTLAKFMDSYLDCVNSVHILPFFPYSSDDGFAVIDYSSVNESLGNWQDISVIAQKKRLMSDLVINHCSAVVCGLKTSLKAKDKAVIIFLLPTPMTTYLM